MKKKNKKITKKKTEKNERNRKKNTSQNPSKQLDSLGRMRAAGGVSGESARERVAGPGPASEAKAQRFFGLREDLQKLKKNKASLLDLIFFSKSIKIQAIHPEFTPFLG